QVEQAVGLSAVLEVSYCAFLILLPVIEQQQDPASPWFAQFVLAGPPAAGGRFALLDAPSLPSTPADFHDSAGAHMPAGGAIAAVVGLSQVLATRLDTAALALPSTPGTCAPSSAERHRHDQPYHVRRPRRRRQPPPRSSRAAGPVRSPAQPRGGGRRNRRIPGRAATDAEGISALHR